MAKPTRVALLDGGEMRAKEYQAYWNYPSDLAITIPTYGVLIDHADGLYLFDTGFDIEHVRKHITSAGVSQSPEQTIPAQLGLLGVHPDDISYVVNSHYHFDHVAGNKFCRHATTVCHKCELESALKPEPFEERLYADRSFLVPEPELDIYTRRVETLTGDQELAKGLHLFETPGHTAGHYSLLVRLSNRRPMLFIGDACYTKKGLDNMLMPSSHVDPVKGYRSMERIKELAIEHDAEIFYAHDSEAYKTYLKAPAWYS